MLACGDPVHTDTVPPFEPLSRARGRHHLGTEVGGKRVSIDWLILWVVVTEAPPLSNPPPGQGVVTDCSSPWLTVWVTRRSLTQPSVASTFAQLPHQSLDYDSSCAASIFNIRVSLCASLVGDA